jgi:signal transduction histidine kinase
MRAAGQGWLSVQGYDSRLRLVFRHVMEAELESPAEVREAIVGGLRLALGATCNLQRLRVLFNADALGEGLAAPLLDPLTYLHTLRLMEDGRATPAGRVLSRLSGRDALRWLLIVELLQSSGPADTERLCASTARELLAVPTQTVADLDLWPHDVTGWPHAWSNVERLAKLGVLSLDDSPTRYGYRVWPEGQDLLREALALDHPMRAVARALLEQEVGAVVAGGGPVQGFDRAAAWVVETMTHGLRNALGPIPFALREIEDAQPALVESPSFERIRKGVRRSLDLITDLDRLHRAAAEPVESFDLAAALRDVVGAANGEGVQLACEHIEGQALVGVRARFVHALVDLIHNARYHARAGTRARVEVSAEVVAGRIVVTVDDDGPGVDDALKARVFEPGFSTRPDGTGKGLALLREVLRHDYRGDVRVLDGPLGGARFELSIPLSRSP